MAEEYFSFEDTISDTRNSYIATDLDGRKVIIQKKNPAKHNSHHPLEQHPTFFLNLGKVIAEPDNVREDRSSNPHAVANRENATVLIYEKENYVRNLNMPGNHSPENWRGDTVEVVVKYSHDDEGKITENSDKNYTLTYILFSN